MSVQRIYLDMDGVLADFDAAARRALGMEPSAFEATYGAVEFWRRLREIPFLYRGLRPMADAAYLVQSCLAVGVPVEVLTAIPRRDSVPTAEQEKREWIAEHFPMLPINFGPYSRDKAKYAAFGYVLIDDRKDNIDRWRAADGIGILHATARDSVRNLMGWVADALPARPQ